MGVYQKHLFLCVSVKALCDSVVESVLKTLTTETQRSHRDTENDFSTV
jgi:hypothetical protein